MVNYELCIMYKVHRRNESSKSWRSRYTPRWKRFLTDGPLKTWESTRVDCLTAISQMGHERAGLSAPHTIPSSQRDLVNIRALTKPKSRLEEDLSPSRASPTRCNVALDAQNNYTTDNLKETLGPFVLHLASTNGPRKPEIGTAQHTGTPKSRIINQHPQEG